MQTADEEAVQFTDLIRRAPSIEIAADLLASKFREVYQRGVVHGTKECGDRMMRVYDEGMKKKV